MKAILPLLVAGYILASLWENRRTVLFVVLLLLGLGLALAAPASAQTINPTRDERTVEVTVQWYPTRSALIQHCHSLGAWPGVPIEIIERQRNVGCAEFYPERKACTVHVLRPRNTDDALTTVFGHEVLHCFLGRYH